MDTRNGSGEFVLRGQQQDIQHPPHADEMEQGVLSELSLLLKKQTTLGAQRMGEVLQTQKKLQQHLETTASTADVALRLFTETLVEVRLYNEEGDKLLKRLVASHQQLNLLTSKQ